MIIKDFSIKDIDKRVIVKEKFSVPKFVLQKSNHGVTFCKKHGKRISLIDRVLSSLYEYPIEYFRKNMDKTLDNGQYYFYYFYDNTINGITYSKIPDNKLSLFKYVDNSANYYKAEDYNKLNTFVHPIIYDGVIDKKIYELLNNYNIQDMITKLNSEYTSPYGGDSFEDLEFIFLTKNNTVIKTYNFVNKQIERFTSDQISIIITNMIEFFSNYNFNNISFNNYYDLEKNYINFIYVMYKSYINNISNITLDRNEFLTHPIFNLNKKFVSRLKIENEELFKFMINLFSTQKRYNSYLINEDDMNKLNEIKSNINGIIEKSINVTNNEFKTFKEIIG